MSKNEKIEALNETLNELCNIKNFLRESGFENPSKIFASLTQAQRCVQEEIKNLRC